MAELVNTTRPAQARLPTYAPTEAALPVVAPFEMVLTYAVVPADRSRRKMSVTPLVSVVVVFA